MKTAYPAPRFFAFTTFFMILLKLSFGQQTVGKETLAIDYFQQGNFEKALPIFAKLAQAYPDNAMYNYYYGVSLIKNNIFETAAKEALLNSVVDKTPVNANFYLGNYFHALAQWQEAMDFYDRYEKAGTRQEKKSLKLDYYVDLCKQKVNPFNPKKTADSSLFGDTLLKPPPKIDENNFPVPEALTKSSFNFQVNESLAYHSIDDFKSEASKVLFTKAWMCTGKNDSILALTDSLRKEHERITRVDTRLGMVQQIVDCEQKSYQLMREREKYLEQSRAKESAYWEREGTKSATAYNAIIQERERKLIELRQKEEKPFENIPEPEVLKDTLTVTQENNALTQEPTKKLNQAENLVFKVQVGSFKNGVLSSTFKQSYAKISKLRKIDKFTNEKKNVVFTVGNFSNETDASKMKDQLIREGMKNSVVITFDKATGKPYKVTSAKPQIKEQQQNKLAKNIEPVTNTTNFENLIFKVQIGSFKNDLKSTFFRKACIKINQTMKVDSYTDSKNNFIYTVGGMKNYQEACKLKDQMVLDGIKDAFVAAFLNGERIKVNEAIKIAGGK